MEHKISKRPKWTLLFWTLCMAYSGVCGIEHYDTEYESSHYCAVTLKRQHQERSLFEDDSNHHYVNPRDSRTSDCIRYEDVNQALLQAKRDTGQPCVFRPFFTSKKALNGSHLIPLVLTSGDPFPIHQRGFVPRYIDPNKIDNNELDRIASVILETTRNLAEKFRLTPREVSHLLPTIDTSKTDIWEICPDMYKPSPCTASRFRTIDGRCSSLKNSVMGMARTPFKRFMLPDYSDGISEPKVSPIDGNPLPHVRKISIKVHPDKNQLTNDRSSMLMSWGQFFGHDLTMAEFAREPNGQEILCCTPEHKPHPNCRPIPISKDDPFYWRYNSTCMEFQRNLAGLRPGCALGPRIGNNFVTARFDANFIYGNSDYESQMLRLGEKGLLRTWPKFQDLGFKDLLPPMTKRPETNCLRPRNKYCVLAGDSRANFQPQVTVLHHVFLREHNRIATELGYLNRHWDDERIFQETRHIIIAVIQHIAFNEMLPLLIGPEFMHAYNLTLKKEGYWYGHDKNVVLGTDLTIQTAAFRWGHTNLHDKFDLYNKNHKFVDAWELHTVVLQPFNLYRQPGVIDKVLGGLVDSPIESFDRFMTSEMTRHLFQPIDQTFGRDLASLNINRGRDNGLPGYNDYREWCGLPRAKTFEELDYYLGNSTAFHYSKIYKHPDEIDLWSAAIAEYIVEGGFVGPTFACIIARQFSRNRKGDRYWYENPGFPSSFTPGQLQEIRKVTQAKITCENADDYPTVQMWTMLLAHPKDNPRYYCKDLPQMNLEFWIEDPHTEEFKYVK